MAIDYGTNSELQLFYVRVGVKSLTLSSFSSAVERWDSHKETDLDNKVDVPGLPTFTDPLWQSCGLAALCRKITPDDSIPDFYSFMQFLEYLRATLGTDANVPLLKFL